MAFLFCRLTLHRKKRILSEKYLAGAEVRTVLLEILLHLSNPELGISDVTAKTYADQITAKPIHRREWAKAVAAALGAGEIERLSDNGHVRITAFGEQHDGIRKTKPGSKELRSLILDALRTHPDSTRAQLLRKIHEEQAGTFVSPNDFRTICARLERSGVVQVKSGKLRLK